MEEYIKKEANEKPQADAGLAGLWIELGAFVTEFCQGAIPGKYMEDIISRYRHPAQSTTDIVLYEGEAKAGNPDFAVLKGHGDNESVCLVPVPYKLIKGQKGQIIFRKFSNEKGGV